MRQPHFQPEITHAFGTPVISFDVPDAARINEELGRGILFPSWLMHPVEPYQGQSTRMSVGL